MALPFRLGRDGAILAVRVTPKAAQDRVLGLSDETDGAALRLAVHAPPRDGEANAAVIALLARHFGLRKSDLCVAPARPDAASWFTLPASRQPSARGSSRD